MERYKLNCPFEGKQCSLRKHCTAIVLAEMPKADIMIRIPCQEVKEKTGGKEKEIVIRIPAA